MSAHMCTDGHFSYLAHAMAELADGSPFYYFYSGAMRQRDLTDPAEVQRVACLLWHENASSLEARYGDAADMVNSPFKFEDLRDRVRFDPVQIIKSIACYQYQACEHDGWKTSEARTMTDALLMRAATKVPGYEDAIWGSPPSATVPADEPDAEHEYQIFRPGRAKPETHKRADPFTLSQLQALVGGYIQVVPMPDGRSLYIHEEGKLEGLEYNEAATEAMDGNLLDGDTIVGVGVAIPAELER